MKTESYRKSVVRGPQKQEKNGKKYLKVKLREN